MSGTPWEDISTPDSLVKRQMRLNTDGRHSIEFKSEQDCSDILALNAAFANRDNASGSLWDGRSMVKVASIPLALIEKWQKEEDIDFMRFNDEDRVKLLAKLNDPQFKKLRTAPGRI
jgi:hypothetical protein